MHCLTSHASPRRIGMTRRAWFNSRVSFFAGFRCRVLAHAWLPVFMSSAISVSTCLLRQYLTIITDLADGRLIACNRWQMCGCGLALGHCSWPSFWMPLLTSSLPQGIRKLSDAASVVRADQTARTHAPILGQNSQMSDLCGAISTCR